MKKEEELPNPLAPDDDQQDAPDWVDEIVKRFEDAVREYDKKDVFRYPAPTTPWPYSPTYPSVPQPQVAPCGWTCPRCGGTGKHGRRNCIRCNSTGRVQSEPKPSEV